MNKTFHIPDGDTELWRALKRIADSRGTSQYRLVRDALAEHLPRVVEQPTPENPADQWARLAPDAT